MLIRDNSKNEVVLSYEQINAVRLITYQNPAMLYVWIVKEITTHIEILYQPWVGFVIIRCDSEKVRVDILIFIIGFNKGARLVANITNIGNR